jgi:hypothetical protein
MKAGPFEIDETAESIIKVSSATAAVDSLREIAVSD